MNKNQLCLTSLVAALPGAFLAILAVMAFISHAGGWSPVLKGLTGLMLLIGAMLAAMPVYIWLSGPKTAKAPKKAEDAKPAEGAVEEGVVASASADDFVADDAAQDDGGLEVAEESAESDPFAETPDEPAEEAGSDAFVDDFEEDSDRKR